MNLNNICFYCSSQAARYKPLPKHLIKLTKKTKNLAPWIHQLVDQKYPDHE